MYANHLANQLSQEKERAQVGVGSSIAGPSSPVAQEVERLAAAVEKTIAITGNFVDRASPVMRAPAPSAETAGKAEQLPETELGERLRSMSRRLESFLDYMQESHARLAI